METSANSSKLSRLQLPKKVKSSNKPGSPSESNTTKPTPESGILKKSKSSSSALYTEKSDVCGRGAELESSSNESLSHVVRASFIHPDQKKVNMVISVQASPPHEISRTIKRSSSKGSSPDPKRVVFQISSDEESKVKQSPKQKSQKTKFRAHSRGLVMKNLLPALIGQAVLMDQDSLSYGVACQSLSKSIAQPSGTAFTQIKDAQDLKTASTSSSVIQEVAKVDTMPNENEFEDSMLFDIFQNMSPIKVPENEATSESFAEGQKFSKVMQYKVDKIMHYVTSRQLHLSLTPLSSEGCIRTCTLHGSWCNTHVKKGDIVNILLPSVTCDMVINDCMGAIVVNPDYLVSSTTLMSSLMCMRKAILQEKFRGWESGNLVMFTGSLVHQLFQEVVKHNMTSEDQMLNTVKILMQQPANVNEMYKQNLSNEQVLENVQQYVPHIKRWVESYILRSSPLVTNRMNRCNAPTKEEEVQVTAVRDIEDNIWCPAYGLKGKIDLTAEVTIHRKIRDVRKVIYVCMRAIQKVIPLELKTGRPSFSFEHEGQVMLYSMMMGGGMHGFNEGLLLYLKDGPQMDWVHVKTHDMRGLIQLRNEIAHYLSTPLKSISDSSEMALSHLPEPIMNRNVCRSCPNLLSCCLYQKVIENYHPPHSSHPMTTLLPVVLMDLRDSHLAYFKKWSMLLHLEMEASVKPSCAFWNEDSSMSEMNGTCFSRMILDPSQNSVNQLVGESFLHKFVKQFGGDQEAKSIKLQDIGLSVNDRVAVSSNSGLTEVAMAFGVIVSISDHQVILSLDSDLLRKPNWQYMVFRVDKVSSNAAINLQFTNLLRLMSSNTEASWLRQLIVDKRAPEFLEAQSKDVVIEGHSILSKLNKSQCRAILKATMAQDYILIKGMPGTGKTSTIVALVTLLVKLGHSVLLTSYTHSAVDNILLKLKENSVNFVRLGSVSRIHPQLHSHAEEILTRGITDVKDLETFYSSKDVVATTCLGINHPLFARHVFDYCIVDEASQILQTTCIGPLFHSKRFVLVGDPIQLPPLVQSKVARKMGMDESLFSLLHTPENTIDLSTQYRMNREIMHLANKLTYNDMLTCGSEQVANKTFDVPHLQEVLLDISSDSWMLHVLGTSIQHSVVFLNLDHVPAPESSSSHGFSNETEACLVVHISRTLLKGGVSHQDVGIISPYQRQVALIREKLQHTGCQNIEVNSIDQYQGRDKEVVIISFVRSNENEDWQEGILDDERRLVVAITRAKVKLVLIGSTSTLKRYKPLQRFFTILRPDQILNLPSNSF